MSLMFINLFLLFTFIIFIYLFFTIVWSYQKILNWIYLHKVLMPKGAGYKELKEKQKTRIFVFATRTPIF